MENQEILKNLNEQKEKRDSGNVVVEEAKKKILVFKIENNKYALDAEKVREIVIDTPLFYIPFVPAYIRGFINRHGEPYTVFDLRVIFEQEKTNSNTFLILNTENDQVTFIISDVIEITDIPVSNIHEITANDSEENFYYASTTLNNEEIFIVSIEIIMNLLQSDLDDA